ncbi:putative CCDC46 protein [Danaus plexippus plexippus]|uniref:CCDC46 protein n=1 Tax=Danaus plexippus plexippus TaxID=278856 RepID=A0A212FI37_DANPL|nr:putative CCDC46 protein [Danaus plexippus plexippus]
MDSSESKSLDTEYKRYLEIMRPYVGQLLDQEVIQICNSWIQRLSNCSETEKVLRNKYIFCLCYQLARGVLDEPFINFPKSKETPLSPLPEDTYSVESTEVECLVLDLDNTNTKILYNNQNNINSATANFSLYSDYLTDQSKNEFLSESNKSITLGQCEPEPICKQSVLCYNCPKMTPKYNTDESIYQYRANNLIQKLREIKKQNLLLHNELENLKKSKQRNLIDDSRDDILKVDQSTSSYLQCHESTTTLKTLKEKLHEVQEDRSNLIETISILQDKLDNITEMNNHEKETLEAKYKLDTIKIKTEIREEVKSNYDRKLADVRDQYEERIKNIKEDNLKELEKIEKNKESVIAEKDKIIKDKDTEINQLVTCIENLKQNQISLLKKFIESPHEETEAYYLKTKTDELTKRLTKIEKSKFRSSKAYEAKITNLQREKHLGECSLQLQLLKQRAQLVGEYAEEHQNELSTALDKLENKYKDIVANVQATAVQRRIQDQMALESIIQAVCGIRNEGLFMNRTQTTCPSQLTSKSKRNPTRDGEQCDNEATRLCRERENRVGSVIVGNKSYGEESSVGGYDLDSDKLGVFFERVHIPQRDTGEDDDKKINLKTT